MNHLGLMSHDSPLYDDVGLGLDASSSEALERLGCPEDAAASNSIFQVMKKAQRGVEDGTLSLYSLQRIGGAQVSCNLNEYQQHVVQWAEQWEQVVTERVDRESKRVRKLQGDREHYEKKVETLRRKSNDLETKGKTSPQGQLAKLERNESKLKEAFVLHETEAGHLCALIEAVTRDGWIDLYTVRHINQQVVRWCIQYHSWESTNIDLS